MDNIDSVVEIPRFSKAESSELETIFLDNQISYEKHAAAISTNHSGGYPEYNFHVPKTRHLMQLI